jgi:hypothetical protein
MLTDPLAVETVVVAHINAAPALAALDGRVYPVKAPQGTATPYVTYQRISDIPETAFGQDPGLSRMRLQLSSFDPDFDAMRTIAVRLKEWMQRWREVVGEVEIQDTFIETDQDLWDEESSLHYNVLDVMLIHREPAT